MAIALQKASLAASERTCLLAPQERFDQGNIIAMPLSLNLPQAFILYSLLGMAIKSLCRDGQSKAERRRGFGIRAQRVALLPLPFRGLL